METANLTYRNISKSLDIYNDNKKEVLLQIYSLLESLCEDLQVPVIDFQMSLLSSWDKEEILKTYLILKKLGNKDTEALVKKEFHIEDFVLFSARIAEDISYRSFVYDLLKEKLLE